MWNIWIDWERVIAFTVIFYMLSLPADHTPGMPSVVKYVWLGAVYLFSRWWVPKLIESNKE